MRERRSERGIILVLVAGVLVVLVGFVALSVDVGVLYSTRASSQAIADAAALAGAFTFISQPTATQPSTAIANATAVATANSILNTAIPSGAVSVAVDIPNQRVTVDIQTAQPTFFAKVMSVNSVDVAARAVAEAGRGANRASCPKPWFIPNTALSASAPCTSCNAGNVMINPGNGQVTNYGLSRLGQQILVKPQQPNQALAPGQFFAIDVGGNGGGAAQYEAAISSCSPPVLCGDLLDVKTGNMVGPTRQGVEALIGSPPRDTYQSVGRYLINGTSVSDVSSALVVAPIWDTCGFAGFCPSNQFPSGTNVSVRIIGFAVIFLEGLEPGNQGSVIGRLINVSGCTPGNSGPVGSAVYSYPLRLVRMP